jgi:hypothetical protein
MKKRIYALVTMSTPGKFGELSREFAWDAAVWLLLISFLWSPHLAYAQTAEVSLVNAAYLYNFVKFVEWPSDASRGAGEPVVICVVGDDRTRSALEPAIVGKKVDGRRIEARSPSSGKDFRACQVLFIGFPDKERNLAILHTLARSSVLTVGQTERFISLGGMINLVEKNGVIELETNPEAVGAASLKVSSRLLVVSRIVGDPRSGESP